MYRVYASVYGLCIFVTVMLRTPQAETVCKGLSFCSINCDVIGAFCITLKDRLGYNFALFVKSDLSSWVRRLQLITYINVLLYYKRNF
jgi:hypothetical protein